MTRTFKNLYPRIYDIDNLWLAWRCARRGGKRKWPSVADFEVDLEQNLYVLQEELREHTYQPGPYRHFTIARPKVRRISAAPFRDRVVHHALMQVMWPLFEARMIHDSYACRVGKGTHAALDRCQHFSRGHRYVLQCDVVQFFASIDHAILRGQLSRHIACRETLALINRILESGEGVLSEHYDNDLDQFIRQELQCRAYLRYCDDFLLFGDEKAQLWDWRTTVMEKLAGLRLTMHQERAHSWCTCCRRLRSSRGTSASCWAGGSRKSRWDSSTYCLRRGSVTVASGLTSCGKLILNWTGFATRCACAGNWVC